MFLALQPDLDTGRVNPGAFARHVAELLGQPSPGRTVRHLTSIAVDEWSETGDFSWLAAIGAIDARLEQCVEWATRPGLRQRFQVWRSVKLYWAWRGRWLAQRVRDEATRQAIFAAAAEREAWIEASWPAAGTRSLTPRLSSAQQRAQKREREQAKAIDVFRRGAARMAQSLADQGKAP
jgi:hypothetical protein